MLMERTGGFLSNFLGTNDVKNVCPPSHYLLTGLQAPAGKLTNRHTLADPRYQTTLGRRQLALSEPTLEFDRRIGMETTEAILDRLGPIETCQGNG